MRILSRLFVIGLLPAWLGAQADSARGGIEGTVYDSVMRRPIAGAVVQVVSAALPSGAMLSAESDARGRYAFENVAPGRYLVGFQHPALDSLALSAPEIAVDVGAGRMTRADLATPSPARIVQSACRAAASDSTGLLIGILRDATSGMTRGTGRVEARWADLVIDRDGIGTRQRSLSGDVTGDGWFAICLPAGEGIAIRGASAGDTSGFQLVNITANAIVRRDVAMGGTARIRGHVVGDGGAPVSAYVGFAGTDRRTTADSSGAFVLEGAAGSQTFEVRALGYAADRRSLSLRAGLDTVIDVSLVSLKRVLDTVNVRATRVFSRDSDGFLQRQRTGNGRFWDADDIARGRYYDIYAALRMASSVQLTESGFTKSMTMRGGLYGRCTPAVYLNGVQLAPDFVDDLDLMVHPDDISGMELYTVAQVPAQYQSLNGCGSLVIWTRPRQRR